MATTTKKIAGHTLTLEGGKRYRAERRMAVRGQTEFTVWIVDTKTGHTVESFDGLSYDAANEMLGEFNDGPTSWDGREWS